MRYLNHNPRWIMNKSNNMFCFYCLTFLKQKQMSATYPSKSGKRFCYRLLFRQLSLVDIKHSAAIIFACLLTFQHCRWTRFKPNFLRISQKSYLSIKNRLEYLNCSTTRQVGHFLSYLPALCLIGKTSLRALIRRKCFPCTFIFI